MATIPKTIGAPVAEKPPATEASGKTPGQQSTVESGVAGPMASGGRVPAPVGSTLGDRGGDRSRRDGQTRHIASGPFTLWDSYARVSLPLSSRRYLLLFCLDGSVELRFGSFGFTLEPGSAAAVDGCLLRECMAGAGTVLLEYRPRDRRYHVCRSLDGSRAFLTIPVTGRLMGWARQVAWDLRRGALFDRYDFCAVGVQLRDVSGGGIPYPLSCAAGCPVWGRCAGTAGYDGTPAGYDTELVTETTPQRILAISAAIIGIGFWGGLLLYFLFRDGMAALGFG